MEYTTQIKQKIANELVGCDTHFEPDQLVAVLDVMDEVGVPDMYEALKAVQEGTGDWRAMVDLALAKVEGK